MNCARLLSTSRLLVCGLGAAALWHASSAQAQQVYKCRLDGHMVFQASPCRPEPAPTVVVAPAPAPAASAAVAPKKKTLAELLRERDAATPAPSATNESKGDGANILRTRMGAV
jgi:hypothetical protein